MLKNLGWNDGSKEESRWGKKWKLFGWQTRGKYKNKFETEDTGFTRSNKLKK